MKNFAKKIILILITGCGFISSILMAAGANASGGAVFVRGSSASVSGGGGYGTNACPYSAGDYQFQSSVECTGVSWIFYKSTGKTAKEIKFPYIASSQYGNWADLTVTIPKSCAEHTDAGGGFWHYGINSNGAGITQNGGTIKKDGGMYGHWATLTWGDATYNSNQSWISYKAPIGNLNQTLPQGSTSSNALYTNANTGKDSRLATVSKDFWEAWLIDNGGDEDKAREAWKTATGAYTHYGDDGYFPSWLSAFCWWDYADYWQTSQVVATSGATKKDKSASATDDLKTNTANVALTVKAGEAVVIDFRHNIFSNKDKETGQQWEVTRYWMKGSDPQQAPFNKRNSDFSVSSSVDSSVAGGSFYTSAISTKKTSGIISSWIGALTGYSAKGPATYQLGNTRYTQRDAMTVTFNEVGNYTFCEALNLKSVNYKTTVCAQITVQSGGTTTTNTLYSRSAVRNSATNLADTGITDTTKSVSSIDATVQEGDSVDVTFLHNIYSNYDTKSEKISWRYTDDKNNLKNTSNYTVKLLKGPTTLSGSTNLRVKITGGYYQSGSLMTYGSDKNLVVDAYKITFKSQGTYEFCESMTITGKSLKTTACTKIKVTKPTTTGCTPGDANCPVPPPCDPLVDPTCTNPGQPTNTTTDDDDGMGACNGNASWTPASYANSGNWSGSSRVANTSVLTAVRNDSLTGTYGDWKKQDGSVATQDPVFTYAKPTDNITWVNCYFPGNQKLGPYSVATADNDNPTQYTYTIAFPDGSSVNAIEPAGTENPEDTLNSLRWIPNNFSVNSTTDSANGIFRAFNGSFVNGQPKSVIQQDGGVTSMGSSGDGTQNYNFNVSLATGNTDIRQTKNTYQVRQVNDAGKYYTEKISTSPVSAAVNYNNHPFGCWIGTQVYVIVLMGMPPIPNPSGQLTWTNCYHSNRFEGVWQYAWYTADNSTTSSSAKVIIPYNFNNSVSFDLTGVRGTGGDDDEVYAGESINVQNAKIKVDTRTNAVTEDTYATQVDNAEVRMVTYVSDKDADTQVNNRAMDDDSIDAWQLPSDGTPASTDLCALLTLDYKQCAEGKKHNNGTTVLNPSGVYDGTEYDATVNGQSNVFDASAGDYMCMVMGVYPWRSGPEGDDAADKTVDPWGTEHKWYITAPKCIKIAKKPSMQVLGASFYSGGNVVTALSPKRNIFAIPNQYPFTWNAGGTVKFGSWVQQAIISNGSVTNMASGASMGINNYNSIGWGNGANDFCTNYEILTIANSNSSGTGICNPTIGAGLSLQNVKNKSAIVDYFAVPGVSSIADDVIALGGAEGVEGDSVTGNDIRYVYKSGNLSIIGGTVSVRMTRVVKVEGNITIDGNLYYHDGNLTLMRDVPKTIIYATGDINISCPVTRVDAVLIADGKVNTCGQYASVTDDNRNDSGRSIQLTINGSVIAGSAEFGRTYGNGVGSRSGEPAEIVNYDASGYIWGQNMANSAESDTMSTVYIRELAPRY